MQPYLDLVAKIVCNHGNDWNSHYGDGRELPGELDHEEQGSNKNHQIPKEKK